MVVYFLFSFISVSVVMSLLILVFSGVFFFLKKLISVVGLFVCSWFCTISVRDPLDVMELSEHFKYLKK